MTILDKHERVRDAYYAQSWPCELCGKVSSWRVWVKLRPTHYCQGCYHAVFPNGQFTGAVIPEVAGDNESSKRPG